jgi:TetR/AcrR family tetracycline transcriptional repressor
VSLQRKLVGKRPLSREIVLREAVALVDEHGLAALSMRSLGRRLGVEAMSIYNHVAGKDALLDGLVEIVLSNVHSAAEDWREAVREIAHRYSEAGRRHPEIVMLSATRRYTTPPWARPTEDLLAAFRRGGFDPAGAVHGYRIVASYISGYVFGELRLAGAPAVDQYLEQIDRTDYPVMHELAQELAGLDRSQEYELGLDLILNTLEQYRDSSRS